MGPEGWPEGGLIPLDRPFVDDRGAIQPLVEKLMRNASLITSRKGSVRANHYHKTDWHYSYVVSGSMEYFHRPTGSTAEPERILVRAGQLVFTPPMIDHAMRFPEDTVFLALSRNDRHQAAYEADTVRIDMVRPR